MRNLRKRIKVCWFLLVIVIGLGLEVYRLSGYKGQVMHEVTFWEPFLKHTFFHLVYQFRLILLSLAPLVNDITFIRTIVATDMLLVCSDRVAVMYVEGIGEVFTQRVMLGHVYMRGLLFAITSLWALLGASAVEAQRRMWLGLRLQAIYFMVEQTGWVIYFALSMHCLSSRVGLIPATIPLLYISSRPALRKSVQGQMLHWMDTKCATRGAASLAFLIGSVPPKEAICMACRRFRCIRHSHLSLEILADNAPNAAHSALSQPCILGSCDAFVSHSWRDQGQAKWQALQAWGSAFVERNSQEATVWFDKCCVDQKAIEMDLRCLPIFLTGCSRLVVLCGPTYLSRLWCVLEIFTFIHMGGLAEEIELVQVLREGFELEDAEAILHAFDCFDARECQCFDEGDKHRILTIIEAAFGSLDEFNCVVRGITEQVRAQLDKQSAVVIVSTGSVRSRRSVRNAAV